MQSTSSVIRRKGRRGRRPLRVVRAGRCQHETAAVRHPGRVRRTRSAWPTVPASPTVRPVASTAQRMRFRGHSPRTISNGRPRWSVIQSRAGVEARPYGGCVWVCFSGAVRRAGVGRRCEKSTSSKTGGFLCENGAPAQEGFTPSECSRRAGSPRRSWSCRRSGRRSGTRRSRRFWRWRRDCGSQESLSFSFKVHSNP